MFEKVKTRIIDSIEHDTDGDRADYVNKYDKNRSYNYQHTAPVNIISTMSDIKIYIDEYDSESEYDNELEYNEDNERIDGD